MGHGIAAHKRGQDGTRLAGELPATEMADLAEALRDLQAIQSKAKTAAGQILTACETLMELLDRQDRDASRSGIETAALDIMTACGFEDLIGQRAAHAGQIVDRLMAKRLEALGCAYQEREKTDAGLAQGRIDVLFAEEL